jgi:circadian clock protein KaiC
MECIDHIVGGGFPVGGMISVSGPCGAGKTLFALEYLIRGAMADQRGVYISTVHGPEKLMTYLPKLDYADHKVFESGKVVLRHIDEMGSGERDDGKITNSESFAMVSDIANAIKEAKAERMVLDATNPILVEMEGWVARSFLLSLSKVLFEAKCTGLLITEGEVEDCQEHTMSDGIIKLGTAVRRGDNYRVLEVLKMSGGAHSRSKYVMDMTSQGLLITPMLRGF